MKKRVIMAMVVAMCVAGSALAETTIGYAGQLRDAEGKALTTLNQRITFALYDAPSGGEALWTATRNVVLSQEGYFNVQLEDDTGVAMSLEKVLQKNSTLYIGLTPKGAAAEIAPRQRILETPHAAVASAAKTGVDGFKVSGTATVTTLAATTLAATTVNVTNVIATTSVTAPTVSASTSVTAPTVSASTSVTAPTVSASTSVTAPTVRAVAIQQQYTDGAEVKYGDLLPKGVIVMWNGEEKDVPAGWALCNGQNNTPDLRGRFIVGVGFSGGETYKPGDIGGTNMVTLTVDQIPKHNHEIKFRQRGYIATYKDANQVFGTTDANNMSWGSESAGGDKPHENRPPYYALCYIMKL